MVPKLNEGEGKLYSQWTVQGFTVVKRGNEKIMDLSESMRMGIT